MSIIALAGKRGAGKDSVAEIIMNAQPGKWRVVKFAEKLKTITSMLTGYPIEDMYSQSGKGIFLQDYGMTIGEFQQKLGTEAVRDNLHTNAWVLSAFADVAEGENILITDCRFPNEMEEVRKRGGLVVRVEGDPLKKRGDGTRDDNHPSETALDDADFNITINNNGSLERLKVKVNQFLAVLDGIKQHHRLTF